MATVTLQCGAIICRVIGYPSGRKWGNGSFGANVAVMLTGTAVGQATSILLAPVLTRLYLPEQFGVLGLYAAALAILGVVGSLGFDMAMPIAETDADLANLLASSGLTLLGTTGLLGLVAWLISDRALDLLWLGSLAPYRYLLPIGFACVGSYYIMVAAATRVSAFNAIASTRISQGLSGPLSQILLGVFGAGATGLMIGFIIGQSSGTYLLYSRVILRSTTLTNAVSWHGLLTIWRRYIKFPLFVGWSRLLDMAGGGAVLFPIISAFYSTEVAGYLFLIERVIARPLFIVSTSLLQVFTGEAGQTVRYDPVRLQRRFWQIISRQFLLAITWIVLANLLAAWAFPRLFGPQWLPAVPYLRALSAAYLALAVLHPVSTSPQIMQQQMVAFIWQVARMILVVASVAVAWRLGLSAVTALWLTALAQVVACMTMLVLIADSIRRIQPR